MKARTPAPPARQRPIPLTLAEPLFNLIKLQQPHLSDSRVHGIVENLWRVAEALRRYGGMTRSGYPFSQQQSRRLRIVGDHLRMHGNTGGFVSYVHPTSADGTLKLVSPNGRAFEL